MAPEKDDESAAEKKLREELAKADKVQPKGGRERIAKGTVWKGKGKDGKGKGK